MRTNLLFGLAMVLLVACGSAGTGTDGGSGQLAIRRVFVTSARYNGDFKTIGAGNDGLEGADRLCNTVAQGAGVPGTYTAWLSSPTVDAIDRIQDVGPWYQITADGGAIKTFNNRANMASAPLAAIQYTESGIQVFSGAVWTGTDTGGRKTSQNCKGFTSQSPELGTTGTIASTSGWTSNGGAGANCSDDNYLYCFQQ